VMSAAQKQRSAGSSRVRKADAVEGASARWILPERPRLIHHTSTDVLGYSSSQSGGTTLARISMTPAVRLFHGINLSQFLALSVENEIASVQACNRDVFQQ